MGACLVEHHDSVALHNSVEAVGYREDLAAGHAKSAVSAQHGGFCLTGYGAADTCSDRKGSLQCSVQSTP
eukprot:3278307-Rhodomonas_salina.3